MAPKKATKGEMEAHVLHQMSKCWQEVEDSHACGMDAADATVMWATKSSESPAWPVLLWPYPSALPGVALAAASLAAARSALATAAAACSGLRRYFRVVAC